MGTRTKDQIRFFSATGKVKPQGHSIAVKTKNNPGVNVMFKGFNPYLLSATSHQTRSQSPSLPFR